MGISLTFLANIGLAANACDEKHSSLFILCGSREGKKFYEIVSQVTIVKLLLL